MHFIFKFFICIITRERSSEIVSVTSAVSQIVVRYLNVNIKYDGVQNLNIVVKFIITELQNFTNTNGLLIF